MASSARSAALRQIGQLFDGGTATGLDDRQLLERFLDRRDELAFAAIVGRHGPMVLGACRAALGDTAEVEDAFQATFLVLMRRAGSIRGRDSLGAWLHRVAHRIAVRAGAEASRRRSLERKAGELAVAKRRIAGSPGELHALLHEEIDRLPDRLRMPVILCDLDGLARADAARQLGWTEGELRGRLARARSRLRDRLARHGFGLSLASLAEALTEESSAAVPGAWADGLAGAAAALPAGEVAAGGAITATAAGLARAALTGLTAESARAIATAATLLAAIVLVGSHTIPAGFAQSGGNKAMKREMPGPKPASPPPTGLTATKPEDPAKAETLAGRVVDPDGKPFAGAKVYRFGYSSGMDRTPVAPAFVSVSGVDGSFQYPKKVTGEANPGKPDPLVAMAPGHGPALGDPTGKAPPDTLKLVKDDVPIRGRIIDIQGRPVQGATVQVVALLWSPTGKLDEWLEKQKTEKEAVRAQYETLHMWASDDIPSLYPVVKADARGRFTIAGIGRERIASLLIEGPGIETSFEYVATRSMPTLRISDGGGRAAVRQITYHGAEFDLVGGPELVATGTVTDKDTRMPLAGVRIETATPFGNPLRTLKTITDSRGRYRLPGLSPKTHFNDGQELLATSKDAPYVPTIKGLDKGNSRTSVTIDFPLKRGVWANGRVVDKSTGEGVMTGLSYTILRGNAHQQSYPPYGMPRMHPPLRTNEDGTFRLAVLPGLGMIGTIAWSPHYRRGVGADTIEGLGPMKGPNGIVMASPVGMAGSYNTVIGIDPKPGDESITCTIELDRGKTVKGKVVDPDGKPLAGARIEGLQDHFRSWSWEPSPTEEFLVEGIGPGDPRDLLVYHEGRKLAGAYTIKPDEAGPIVVKLEPGGAVVGRLIDADGLPLAEAEISCHVPFGDTSAAYGSLPQPLKTVQDGRFRAEWLVPGRKYSFHAWSETKRIGAQVGKQEIVVRSGEVRDLGDIVMKLEKPQ